MMQGSTAQRGRVKPKMRPPRPLAPDTAIDETWKKLSHAIKEIQQHNASRLSFEEHYRYSYNMVLYKHGDMLYKGVKGLISDHLRDLAEREIVPSFPRSGVMSTVGGTAAAGVGGIGMGSGSTGLATSGTQAVEMVMEGERLLKAIKAVWDDHMGSMSKLRQVLKYMDKVYTSSAKVATVEELGLQLFTTEIARSNRFPIRNVLLSALLTQIHCERIGETINRSAMKEVVEIMSGLETPIEKERKGALPVVSSGSSRKKGSIYDTDFEGEFFKSSERFYQQEAESFLSISDSSDYLRKVESRILEEHARCSQYLLTRSTTPLIAILDENLLTAQLLTILDRPGSGLVAMIDGDSMGDLNRVYRLFGRSGVPIGLDVLKRELKKAVLVRGMSINEAVTAYVAGPSSETSPAGSMAEASAMKVDRDPLVATALKKGKGKAKEGVVVKAEPVEPAAIPPAVATTPTPGISAAAALSNALRWVQEVLDLKDKFDHVLKDGFFDDKGIQTAINDAFQTVINVNPKAQEYISLFIDDNLKKGSKGKTEDEVEVVLEKTIVLFRFINDKDLFELYYKGHLAKRLLNGRSISEDSEKSMIAKLKVEAGYQFTQKLEGMFNDLRLSDEMMRGFERTSAKADNKLDLDLQVTVLTSTFWPGDSIAKDCIFPQALQQGIEAFSRFYDSRHSGRKLVWHASHGTAELGVTFKARKHDLSVSTYQLVVLLLFQDLEDKEELSLRDIGDATTMPKADLARTLQSLSVGKYRILKKNPPTKDIGDADKFCFNSGFTCALQKIKIPTIVGKVETKEESAATQGQVAEERKLQVDACIVRIMKSRQTMTHNELVNEVVRQLQTRFSPSPAMVKKGIESLLDREYLERADGVHSYNYLA